MKRTLLTLDGNSYLASVADPGGNTSQFAYTSGGLLTTMTTPRGSQWPEGACVLVSKLRSPVGVAPPGGFVVFPAWAVT